MNFEFSDEQKSAQQQAQQFLSAHCAPFVVHQVLDGKALLDKSLWRDVARRGWLSVAVPENYGGAGSGYLDLCVIAEEFGRALAPIPFGSSRYLAAEAIIVAGDEVQKRRVLPALCLGEAIGTLAVAEGVGELTKEAVATCFADGVLNGAKISVPDGMVADVAIVLAMDTGASAPVLALVDLKQSGVHRSHVKSIDPSRPLANLSFQNVRAEVLGGRADGWPALNEIQNRAAVLFAFEQLGGAEAALELARNYALDRRTFGRPVASYQAVKHKLADIYALIEIARSNAYFAAWALDSNSSELSIAAASARIAATEAFHQSAKENVHLHGGTGYRWDGDSHLYYRRSRHLGLNLGSVRAWKERLICSLEAHMPVQEN